MSYWDVHFLVGFIVALLIMIIYGGLWDYLNRSTSVQCTEGLFIIYTCLWLILLFVVLSLLHLWLDVVNPRLWLNRELSGDMLKSTAS